MRHHSIALTPDKRCPLCVADYNRFRPGLDFGTVAGELGALDREISNSAANIRDADVRTFRGRCAVLGEMARRRRAAWDAEHGPGRCFPDVWTPIVERTRETGPLTDTEQDWNMRELMASLLLDDEGDAGNDESVDVKADFDPSAFDAVPEWIDDGSATTCIAA